MSSAARTEIIARLRGACKGSPREQVAVDLETLGPTPQSALPSASLAESFVANVLRNGGTADCVTNKSAAASVIAQYVYQRYRTRKLVAGSDPRLAAMPWRDGGVLPRFGEAEDGDMAAVSYARLGVAESGSIVTWTGKANPARNNLLVEDHIVLLDLIDLVATLDQAWEYIEASMTNGRHRGVNFISAPSSTADIDMELVKGAHGPRGWHVVLIADEAEAIMHNAHLLAGVGEEHYSGE